MCDREMMSTPYSRLTGKPVVAAFDLDRTLTVRDCVLPFVFRLTKGKILLDMARDSKALRALIARDRDDVKKALSRRAFGNKHRSEIEAVAKTFADRVVDKWLRPDTLARLSRHKEMGHVTVIVSASYGVYVQRIASLLGVDHTLATELDFDDDGKATGRLRGENCRGHVKASRLRDLFSQTGLQDPFVFAYGDSAGDREMLAFADVPTKVGRSRIDREPDGGFAR